MGEAHARVYAGIPGAVIAAVVDAHPDAARKKLPGLGLAAVPVFASLREALASAECDVVDICLPTDLHAEVAVEALRAGKHVFCEKPLALSPDEARRIREARDASGACFQVGHCIRFWPEYQALEKLVRDGEHGRLLSLALQRRVGRPGYSNGNWLNDPRRSLGAAFDLHVHDTDFVLHLLGTPPAVYARGTRDESGWSHIFTDYLYPDVVVHAEGGWNYPSTWGFRMSFQAVFENAAVEYDSAASPTLRITARGEDPRPLPFVPAGAGIGEHMASHGGYANELIYFLDHVARREAPRISTLEQAAESIRVVLSEMRSAEIGSVVLLEPSA